MPSSALKSYQPVRDELPALPKGRIFTPARIAYLLCFVGLGAYWVWKILEAKAEDARLHQGLVGDDIEQAEACEKHYNLDAWKRGGAPSPAECEPLDASGEPAYKLTDAERAAVRKVLEQELPLNCTRVSDLQEYFSMPARSQFRPEASVKDLASLHAFQWAHPAEATVHRAMQAAEMQRQAQEAEEETSKNGSMWDRTKQLLGGRGDEGEHQRRVELAQRKQTWKNYQSMVSLASLLCSQAFLLLDYPRDWPDVVADERVRKAYARELLQDSTHWSLQSLAMYQTNWHLIGVEGGALSCQNWCCLGTATSRLPERRADSIRAFQSGVEALQQRRAQVIRAEEARNAARANNTYAPPADANAEAQEALIRVTEGSLHFQSLQLFYGLLGEVQSRDGDWTGSIASRLASLRAMDAQVRFFRVHMTSEERMFAQGFLPAVQAGEVSSASSAEEDLQAVAQRGEEATAWHVELAYLTSAMPELTKLAHAYLQEDKIKKEQEGSAASTSAGPEDATPAPAEPALTPAIAAAMKEGENSDSSELLPLTDALTPPSAPSLPNPHLSRLASLHALRIFTLLSHVYTTRNPAFLPVLTCAALRGVAASQAEEGAPEEQVASWMAMAAREEDRLERAGVRMIRHEGINPSDDSLLLSASGHSRAGGTGGGANDAPLPDLNDPAQLRALLADFHAFLHWNSERMNEPTGEALEEIELDASAAEGGNGAAREGEQQPQHQKAHTHAQLPVKVGLRVLHDAALGDKVADPSAAVTAAVKLGAKAAPVEDEAKPPPTISSLLPSTTAATASKEPSEEAAAAAAPESKVAAPAADASLPPWDLVSLDARSDGAALFVQLSRSLAALPSSSPSRPSPAGLARLPQLAEQIAALEPSDAVVRQVAAVTLKVSEEAQRIMGEFDAADKKK